MLDGFNTIIDVPVAWGEMDALGHVNNIVFFRYFESARIAYLRAIGLTGGQAGAAVGPILHSTHCRYRRPLTFPDTARVGARATLVGTDRFTMEYRIVSSVQQQTAAEGGGIIVAYDYAHGCKVDLPQAVRDRIREIDNV